MRGIKAIIVDDEENAREILKELLERFCPQVEVIDLCADLEEGVLSIKKSKPDLVFLDMEMPNYAGYEIVSFFAKITFDIVFVTAYDKYALKAFEISAVDYLLKPIQIDRLKKSVERVEKKKGLSVIRNTYKILMDNLSNQKLTKIIIPHQGEQKIILLSDIIVIEANEAYALIHIKQGQRFLVSRNLKYYENLFSEHSNFFRVHKSWFINTDMILSYSKSNLTITLKNGMIAKLSKYKKEDFEKVI